MKWFLGLLVLGFGALALGQSSLLVRIAVAAPLSGSQAKTGQTIRDGAQLAVLEAKNRFAKMGIKLEFVAMDDQADQVIGLQVAQKLVKDPAVLGLVGHMNSGVTLKTQAIYAPANLTMISPSSTNPLVTEKGLGFMNRVCGRDDVQGPVAAEFVRNVLKARRVMVINDGEDYGVGVSRAFVTRAKALGLAVVGFVSNSVGELSDTAVTALTQQIKLYNPQVVYYGGTEVQGAQLIKILAAAKSRATFIGPDGLDNSNFVTVAGNAVVGAYFTSTAGPIAQLRGRDVNGFVKRYTSNFKAAPETYSPYAYDAANMILEAIVGIYDRSKKIGSRAEISREVRNLEWDGVTGRIRLNQNGDRQNADYYVLQYKTAKYPGVLVKAIQSAPPTK